MSLIYPGSLHNHTEYSNLRLRDCIVRVKELIEYAGELGHEVVAFTEHETISNAIQIENEYNKVKDKYPNLKVIKGNEIYLCRNGLTAENFDKDVDRYYHFILLAKDAIGHQQIRELSTRAWHRSWMNGKMRRVPTYYEDLKEIIQTNPGHVIGSTACLGSFLDVKLMQWDELGRPDNVYQWIIDWLKNIEKIFGQGNLYLEMQPSSSKEQKLVNAEIIKLSQITNIPYIITCDTHYLKKEDFAIHKAFLTAQNGDREVESFYASTYLMDDNDIRQYFDDEEVLQTAYQNILNIKNQCEDYSLKKPLKIPSLQWKIPTTKTVSEYWIEKIPYLKEFAESDFNGDEQLAKLIIDKLEFDTRLQNQETYDEINDNLRIVSISSKVNKAHWSAYFLNLQKIIDICWDAGTLVGPGRGSGVGFLLLYILDIIQINPIWETTKTFSWRFLNPDRVSVLDIDTDIEGSKRAQVLKALRNFYGEDRVANVATFGTEKSKSAIQTAARGLSIDIDIAAYISSLVPSDRGITRTLKQCYYGDEENDYKPIALFVQEMNKYPDLWAVSQKIEGLICRMGEHAGGVIFTDEPFTNSTALMRVPNGDLVTQFDLHDCEDVSLIKIDLLSVEALDKIHACIDLLCEDKLIEAEPTLRETYEKVLNIYKLERTNKDMWHMVWEHKIQTLFQMEQQSGIQGIALTHPESVDDLAVLNSVIRLMAQDKDSESPLEKYARFKNNIQLWYDEMLCYGLNKEEQKVLEPILKSSYGICESQEKFMQLVQMPECGGFDLGWADRLRKSIAKKNPQGFLELEQEYYDNIKEKHLSERLCNYVWKVLIYTSRGYGFNASHTLAYSLIGLQEMNLAFKFPIIYWNTACLIVNSGSLEDTSIEEEVDIFEPEDDIAEGVTYIDSPDKKTKIRKISTDYAKVARALGDTLKAGIKVSLTDINKSNFGFKPDVKNNQILFGLKGLLNVSDEVIAEIIAHRPYKTPKDFVNKIKPKKQVMISLIKSGAFDKMIDRRKCMVWYLWSVCDKKKNLTLQNMPGLIKYNLLPEETEEQIMARRVYEFNRYLKACCKLSAAEYQLTDRAIDFLAEIDQGSLIKENNILNAKSWDKVYQKWMDVFRKWLGENKDEVLEEINNLIFMDEWNKYAKNGNISAWEMEAMCFYYHEHELKNLNNEKYGISNFFTLPEEPVVDRTFTKKDKEINLYKLTRIAGTCIAKNKSKSTVTLLTTTGVVNVKFNKDYFSMFDKIISEKQPDGTKKRIETSWFNRGEMIIVNGMRSGDNFIAKKYASTAGHTLYRILNIDDKGFIELQGERVQME